MDSELDIIIRCFETFAGLSIYDNATNPGETRSLLYNIIDQICIIFNIFIFKLLFNYVKFWYVSIMALSIIDPLSEHLIGS